MWRRFTFGGVYAFYDWVVMPVWNWIFYPFLSWTVIPVYNMFSGYAWSILGSFGSFVHDFIFGNAIEAGELLEEVVAGGEAAALVAEVAE